MVGIPDLEEFNHMGGIIKWAASGGGKKND